MTTMHMVNFSTARTQLNAIIDRVNDDGDYTVIRQRKGANAVVMSLDSFNSLMETLYLLKSPANAAYLARSIKQYRQGKIKERD
jgi:antitoxin YefM